MKIAIFGDVHGALGAMYDYCAAWEATCREKIALVLQAGDMGLWGSAEEIDKATRKHFATDPSELGATEYLSGEKNIPIETWFVHGNHENFSLLAEKENQYIGSGDKLYFLGPATVKTFKLGKEEVRIAGLGGMEYRFGKFPLSSPERVQKYLFPPAAQELMNYPGKVDVLILHEAPLNKGLKKKFPTGSKRITELIENLQPRWVFYGHYDDPPDPFMLGQSTCVCMNHPAGKRLLHREGAMGILDTSGWHFEFVT